MKKTYSDEVKYLSSQTGISKYRCETVLKESGGDINEAFRILNEIRSNKYEKAMDTISAIARGERGSIITIKEGGESMFRIPCLMVVLLLLLIDIPSWVIAVVLLLVVVFGAEADMSFTEKNDEIIRTVKMDEYKKRKKIAMQIHGHTEQKGVRKTEDGYNEIIID